MGGDLPGLVRHHRTPEAKLKEPLVPHLGALIAAARTPSALGVIFVPLSTAWSYQSIPSNDESL